ncbi:2-hydroxychromene-2-carboxylate isomerase [Rubrobacter radiotolerans]|uniref:2-hydroxychromene-2-carboxylate isomerase n=1 Tax=Rubrobacter radiotolerans TaxID=42256 RepID=A0A023X107_RUBRA|nr:2-hydroxychromene-2-carboxylate isomerase [Rubrobacter radiotolerans]AHY45896.1 2-hydroxychromene-2-carboxylate isomerase [Rubrobacter radiotolerans]MDX5893310.1 2-hydroxychromene-2-carboxylate isomerase [Rubrobacter radiotolerans]SMC03471.1 2-hydroxychromene-2-carboxylate isomerase [Rubrobacter radiotolerans DSM 5868]
MKTVEFYYDLVSPYSYLARGRVAGICESVGAELVMRPAFLGGVHKLSGNQAPVAVPLKGRHAVKDIHRWARYYGLAMRFPEPFPFRTMTTMRAAVYCEEIGRLDEFNREAFRLYWEEGGAPEGLEADESGPLKEVARRVGLDPEELLDAAGTDRVKVRLKEKTEAAVERGVFGMPTFFVGEEMFWGNDRLHFVQEALR